MNERTPIYRKQTCAFDSRMRAKCLDSFNHESILHAEMLEPPNLAWCASHGVRDCKWEAPELERYSYLDM